MCDRVKMSGQIVCTFLEWSALMKRQSEHAGIQNKSNPYIARKFLLYGSPIQVKSSKLLFINK